MAEKFQGKALGIDDEAERSKLVRDGEGLSNI